MLNLWPRAPGTTQGDALCGPHRLTFVLCDMTHLHTLTNPPTPQGYNARPQNVELVIDAFRDGLQKQGKL
jgi:hypothetical protein